MYRILVENIPIEVEPKRIRTLRLSVKTPDARVHISCPLLCPEDEVRRFAEQHIDWIRNTQHRVIQRAAQQQAEPPITTEEAQRFAWRLDAMLKACLTETGERINGYRIRLMRTEWGSCNPRRKTLVFNLALARHTDACLRYVVIHEICHLRYANHSPAFWNEVAKYCPDWQVLRRELRKKDR